MVFINGIKAPLIQVTNPKIKNNPAIIRIGTNELFLELEVSLIVFDIVKSFFE